MTGNEILRRCHAKLSRMGFSTVSLAPDKMLELLVDQMVEINTRTTLMPAYVSFDTVVSQRRYRLTVEALGYLNILKILRASQNGIPVWPEKALQFIGEVDSGTTPEIGPPRHIWIESETMGASGALPISEKTYNVFPLPDAVYTVQMVCRMPIPAYTNMAASLPVRYDSHEAILTACMAELFAGKDFHDNAMKVLWEQKRRERESELYGWDARQVMEHPPEISARTLVAVE